MYKRFVSVSFVLALLLVSLIAAPRSAEAMASIDALTYVINDGGTCATSWLDATITLTPDTDDGGGLDWFVQHTYDGNGVLIDMWQFAAPVGPQVTNFYGGFVVFSFLGNAPTARPFHTVVYDADALLNPGAVLYSFAYDPGTSVPDCYNLPYVVPTGTVAHGQWDDNRATVLAGLANLTEGTSVIDERLTGGVLLVADLGPHGTGYSYWNNGSWIPLGSRDTNGYYHVPEGSPVTPAQLQEIVEAHEGHMELNWQ